MDTYYKIRDDAFQMTRDALMEKIGDGELLKVVDTLKDSPYDSFGLVKGLEAGNYSQVLSFGCRRLMVGEGGLLLQ